MNCQGGDHGLSSCISISSSPSHSLRVKHAQLFNHTIVRLEAMHAFLAFFFAILGLAARPFLNEPDTGFLPLRIMMTEINLTLKQDRKCTKTPL